MAQSQGDLDRLLKHRTAAAAVREQATGLANRKALAATDLREVIRSEWQPHWTRLEGYLSEWADQLRPTGLDISVKDQTEVPGVGGASSKLIEVRDAHNPNAQLYPFRITVSQTPDAQISFVGPKGNVINGDQGHVPLFGNDPVPELWRAVTRYLMKMGGG